MDNGVPKRPLWAPKGVRKSPKGSNIMKIKNRLFKKLISGLI